MASAETSTPSKADSLSREQLVKYIRKLRSDLTSLQQELDKCKADAEDVSRKAPAGHGEPEAVETNSRLATERIESLEAENADLHSQLENATGGAGDPDITITKLSSEKAQLLDKLRKVKPALQRAQATKAELATAEAALVALRAELQDHTEEFQRRGEALATARSSVIALQKELAAAQSATTNSSEMASQAQTVAEARVAALQKTIDGLRSQAAAAAAAHAAALQQAHEDAQEKLSAAAATANEENTRLQDAVAAADARTADARREAAAAQAQLLAQQAAAGSTEATAAQTEEQLLAAQDEARAAKAAVAKQQRALRQLKAALRAHTAAPAWYASLASVTLPHVHVTTSSPPQAAAAAASPGGSTDAATVSAPSSVHAHLEVAGGGEQWHLLVLPAPPRSAADMRGGDTGTHVQWVTDAQLREWGDSSSPPASVTGSALRCTSDAPVAAPSAPAAVEVFSTAAHCIAYMQEHTTSRPSSPSDASAALASRFRHEQEAAAAAAAAAEAHVATVQEALDAATAGLAQYKAKAHAAMRRGGGADAASRRLEGQLADAQDALDDAKSTELRLLAEVADLKQQLASNAASSSAPSPAAQPAPSGELAALQDEVSELQEALAASKGEQRRLQSIAKGHAKAMKQAEAAGAAAQEAAAREAALQEQLLQLQAQLATAEGQLRAAKASAVENTAEVDALRLQLAVLSRRPPAPPQPAAVPDTDNSYDAAPPTPQQIGTRDGRWQHDGNAQHSSASALEAAVGAALAGGGDTDTHSGHAQEQHDDFGGSDTSAALEQMQTRVLELQGQLADAHDEAASYRQQLQRQVAELAQLRSAVHDMRTAAAQEEGRLGGGGGISEEEGVHANSGVADAAPSSPAGSVSSSVRRGGGVGSSTQLVYLKNALVSWATARDVGDKRRMLPALRTLLKLSAQDEERIAQALEEEASVSHGLQSAGMGLLSSVFG